MKQNVVIVGGGFFGLCIALYVYEKLGVKDIVVLEANDDYMQRASYVNQARVHNGYHYPRSLLTGIRSRVNLPVFVKDFPEAVYSSFGKYYAVASKLSKVTAPQFKLYSERIGAEISEAPDDLKQLFDKHLIEDVFLVKEFAFDSSILKHELLARIAKTDIKLLKATQATKIAKHSTGIQVSLSNGSELFADRVFNCTYSSINMIHKASNLPVIPLKHELVEMCLVELPRTLNGLAVTVMDGPFFSFMPFPDKKLYTLSHVRYTPHSEWHDTDDYVRDGAKYLREYKGKSNFMQMKADVTRYIPAFEGTIYKDSLWEVKTLLPKSEDDDSRPILFRADHGLKGYTVVMGGKIDNIYDVYKELDVMYGKE